MAQPPARILLAEDTTAIRAVVAFMLRARGYEVVEAVNGQEALDHAFAQPPDLVILDVLMPVMNGFEACARLKSAPETRHVPIVLLTAVARDSGKDDVHWKKVSGADEFVFKPFKANDLLTRVERLLARAPQEGAPSVPAARAE